MSENRLYATFWIGLFLVIAFVAKTIVNYHHDKTITLQQMVKDGADPTSTACALNMQYSTDQCNVYNLTKAGREVKPSSN